ncbi:tail fiber domain-containing protein [Pseudomarimonas arenosa]|uniref:Peptidase S74 domain-containing protein n=1 Tax=Pseudomarimonas arenosa TaxID=2774145 RepID=A0AAW3ZKG7_9GAMM|nr:tail fiber domain-containing protein [Pseudomarimonas arenosa]MBD8525672.1 hypothetical protein [Pseudomarimonas arenosa]
MTKLRIYPQLLPLTLVLLASSAAATDLQLEAELLQDGKPAEADFEVRVLIDRGQPWLRHIESLGVHRVEQGRLNTAVHLNEQLLQQAESFELQARPAGSQESFSSLASVPAKGSCALSPWTLTGNGDATLSSFIGTTNTEPLRLRAQNQQVGHIDVETAVVSGQAYESVNLILGWSGNFIGSNAYGNTVLGGALSHGASKPQLVANGASHTTISGGYGNEAKGTNATIGGGNNNVAASGSTISGGVLNSAHFNSVIGGGARNRAEGNYGTIAGGDTNSVENFWSTVPGGLGNQALGELSFAAGSFANALHTGTFVWSQSADAGFSSSADRQVLFQARGGFGINGATGPIPGTPLNAELTLRTTGSPDNNVDLMLLNRESDTSNFRGFSLASVPNGQFFLTSLYNNGGTLRYDPLLGVFALSDGISVVSINRGNAFPQAGAVLQIGNGGNDGNGAYLSGGGTWTNASSREFKTAFSSIDPELILERLLGLPLSSWAYKDSVEGRHLGPVAEEFAAAFSLGSDPQRISTVDADGVSMAAIQGLNTRLERQNAALLKRIETLEKRLGRLEQGTP